MIEAVAERGYVSTPVAEVIARAGVSRKAFYEHFPNKETCALEAADEITKAALELVSNPHRATDADEARAQAAIQALLARAMASPRSVRFVLLELTAIGEVGVARREYLITTFERRLQEFIEIDPSVPIPYPILRATVGGINSILYSRAAKRGAELTPELAAELVGWIALYRHLPESLLSTPEHRRPPAVAGGRAPGTLSPAPVLRRKRGGVSGSAKRSHSLTVHSQRERILDAVANLSAARGYALITVSNIGEQAGVSLDTFYGHFAGKEDAFLVAYEVGHAKGLAIVERACSSATDWPSRIRAGIAALFDFLASEPMFAHLALVDALLATTRTAERARQGLLAYAKVLIGDRQADFTSAAGSLITEAITGGLFEICLTYTLQKRTWDLPTLIAPTTYFVLAPAIGVEDAARVALESPRVG
jgi:AcrR family transcriptional regulator